MLLPDFFASARLHRLHKNVLLAKDAVSNNKSAKSNNIIGQRKTTYKEKHFYP